MFRFVVSFAAVGAEQLEVNREPHDAEPNTPNVIDSKNLNDSGYVSQVLLLAGAEDEDYTPAVPQPPKPDGPEGGPDEKGVPEKKEDSRLSELGQRLKDIRLIYTHQYMKERALFAALYTMLWMILLAAQGKIQTLPGHIYLLIFGMAWVSPVFALFVVTASFAAALWEPAAELLEKILTALWRPVERVLELIVENIVVPLYTRILKPVVRFLFDVIQSFVENIVVPIFTHILIPIAKNLGKVIDKVIQFFIQNIMVPLYDYILVPFFTHILKPLVLRIIVPFFRNLFRFLIEPTYQLASKIVTFLFSWASRFVMFLVNSPLGEAVAVIFKTLFAAVAVMIQAVANLFSGGSPPADA